MANGILPVLFICVFEVGETRLDVTVDFSDGQTEVGRAHQGQENEFRVGKVWFPITTMTVQTLVDFHKVIQHTAQVILANGRNGRFLDGGCSTGFPVFQ